MPNIAIKLASTMDWADIVGVTVVLLLSAVGLGVMVVLPGLPVELVVRPVVLPVAMMTVVGSITSSENNKTEYTASWLVIYVFIMLLICSYSELKSVASY